jgi:SAM-dependent methyltransferase
MGNSDTTWKKWGRVDPYYAVLTSPEYHRQEIDRHRNDFFELGESSASALANNFQRFFGAQLHGRALDFGCGPGRVLVALAHRCESVVGVDISPDMLKEARRNCDGFGISNVAFAESNDTLSNVSGTFDFVHSHLVLQHIPVKRGLAIADRLLGLVNPGGLAMLHFSVERQLSWARKPVYAIKHNVPLGLNFFNVLQRKPWNYPAMEMNNYPPGRILAAFQAHGFADVVTIPEQHPTAFTLHFYGRKALENRLH